MNSAFRKVWKIASELIWRDCNIAAEYSTHIPTSYTPIEII